MKRLVALVICLAMAASGPIGTVRAEPAAMDAWFSGRPLGDGDTGVSELDSSSPGRGLDESEAGPSQQHSPVGAGEPEPTLDGVRVPVTPDALNQGPMVFGRWDPSPGDWDIWIRSAAGAEFRLTSNDQLDYWPTISPDGSKVAFVSERDGNREIYVGTLTGSSPITLTAVTNLTRNTASDMGPSWSPDSKEILFDSFRDGDWDLYRIDVSGLNLSQVTFNSGADVEGSWSPDGGRIVWSQFGSNWNIVVRQIDGPSGSEVPLTDHPGTDGLARWSPNGEKIVFVTNRYGPYQTCDDTDVLCVWEIMSLDISSKILTRVTNTAAKELFASYTPDGLQITFDKYESPLYRIWAVNASDGGGIQQVMPSSTTPDRAPSWKMPVVARAPGRPVEVKVVSVGRTSATIRWSASVDYGGTPSVTYTTYLSSDNGLTWRSSASPGVTLVANYSNLVPGTSYLFKVVTNNSIGRSAETTPISFSTIGDPPGAPRDPSVLPYGSAAILSWLPPTSAGSAPITVYQVEARRGAGNWAFKNLLFGSPSVIPGLDPGVTYSFRVKAQNAFGYGAVSPSVTITMPYRVPSRPETLVATNRRRGLVRLSWRPPASSGGRAVERYEIAVSKNSGRTWSQPGEYRTSGRSFIMSYPAEKADTRFWFKVRAVSSVGAGPWSSAVTIVTKRDGAETGSRIDRGLKWDARG